MDPGLADSQRPMAESREQASGGLVALRWKKIYRHISMNEGLHKAKGQNFVRH